MLSSKEFFIPFTVATILAIVSLGIGIPSIIVYYQPDDIVTRNIENSTTTNISETTIMIQTISPVIIKYRDELRRLVYVYGIIGLVNFGFLLVFSILFYLNYKFDSTHQERNGFIVALFAVIITAMFFLATGIHIGTTVFSYYGLYLKRDYYSLWAVGVSNFSLSVGTLSIAFLIAIFTMCSSS